MKGAHLSDTKEITLAEETRTDEEKERDREIFASHQYRVLLARYDGVARAAQDAVGRAQILEAQAKSHEAEKRLWKLQESTNAGTTAGQINKMNQDVQDLALEVNRLRDLVRSLGGNPDKES